MVNGDLIERVKPDQCCRDSRVDVRHRFQDAFAEITALVAIAQLQCFVFASTGATGYRRAPKCAALELHIHFNGWITTGIENLAGLNLSNFSHWKTLAPFFYSISLTGSIQEIKHAQR